MAEALGIASGVAGIVSLGIEVCQGLLEYYGSWKDAESEVMTTYNSMKDLTKILLIVESTLNSQDQTSEIIVKIHDNVALCKGGIAQLNKKLQKIKVISLPSTTGEKLLSQARRALYPFKKSTLIKLQEIVEELQAKLHLTLTTLNINISLQHFDVVSGQLKHLSIEANKTQIGIGNIQNSLADIDRRIDTIESLYGSEYLQKFCDWLSPIFNVFEKKHHDVYALPGRQDWTWEWLQDTQEFKNWLSRTERVLWCPGQPGVGKTVLSSSIINYLETQVKQPGIGIAYIYCDYNNALLTVPNFIANLLQQLFRQSPKSPENLLKIYKSYTKDTVHPRLGKCSILLRDVIESFSHVFIVVDGLDECPHREIDDIRDQLLDQLLNLPLKTQLLFTSRDLPAIALRFATDQRLEIHASRQAIEGYLQARINNSKNLRRHIQRKPSLQQAIVEMVAQKADGMFLLVRMYIDLLATKNVLGMVESTLRNLPEGLKELDTAYDDVITRIQNQDDDDVMMAKQILTWLYYAARPLNLQQLRHSLAVNLVAEADPDAIELDEDFLPDEEIIVSVCAGIVTCHAESNTVSFIHYTTKEYFKRRMDRQEIERFLHLEINIAETCLMYLSFERKEFEDFLTAREEHIDVDPELYYMLTFQRHIEKECLDWDLDTCYPLFHYAARYWGDHVKDMLGQVTQDLFMRFVQQRTGLEASVQVLAEKEYYGQRFPISISGLCLASFFGLEGIVTMLLEDGQNVNAKNEDDWTALHIAATRGHAAIVQLLIDKGASVNAVTDVPDNETSRATALHWAARSGHENVLDILLNNGADIDLRTGDGETALHWAAGKGHVGAIALLLNRGADLEAKSVHGFTPLCTAARSGQEAGVMVLIERGADLSVTTEGDSLLHFAAKGRNVEIVQLLLDKGFDVNLIGASGEYPLHAAAGSFGYRLNYKPDGVVRLLLREGADISNREGHGRTALHASALMMGGDKTARLLLESGIEVDAQDDTGETALHVAAKFGSDTVVQILIEHGADVTAETEYGETALEFAAWNGHEAIVRLLLEHLDGEDSEAWLATSRIFDVAMAGDVEAMQLLLDQGADISTAEDYEGKTPLHMAASRGHVALSRLLLENGADVDAIDLEDYTPLARAAQYGDIEVVRLLLEHEADITLGEPPLFCAIDPSMGYGDVEIVQLLLENGADVSATHQRWGTTLDAAMHQDSELIIDLLLEYGAVVGPQNKDGETAETALD
ncbi:putative ankyrin repeat protein [Trichoderma atroviride IMI 206040]|uniref:Ankyrin repeat protein n=1 Tax=Hypocrea atroviridis (strain ATCC 20476 / IMI 206040) TaxID=452589 RepID=G9P7M4_HYPAI|nr:putative ankyrin repeat protein [Trichoderma atroviride IMI 206040]EHK41615.1 putative ankyrin repeat protein [Trichoderma atroviride IMI 206040]